MGLGDEPGRRAGTRSRSLLSCRVVYGEAFLTLEAVVRNLDQAGCLVRLSTDVPLPTAVWLIISRRHVAYRARVAWRNGRDLGLAFQEERNLSVADNAESRMLRRVWLGMADRAEQPEREGRPLADDFE